MTSLNPKLRKQNTLSLNFEIGLCIKKNYTHFVPAPFTSPTTSPPRAWAEVNLTHLKQNHAFARTYGDTMAVLKAGGYGHGMAHIAQALESMPTAEKPTFFGVASVIEARTLAEAGIKTRIYLLGPSCSFEHDEIITRGWTPCISSLQEAQEFNRRVSNTQTAPLAVHIAVDTGMGRGGFLPEDLLKHINTLDSLEHLSIEGIGSHLPSADEDEVFTRAQFELFDSLIDQLGADRFRYRHLANSAGMLGSQSRHTNLYRPGLMLYGISPLPDYQEKLAPVLSLKSRVSLVRELPKGHSISYGREIILEKNTQVATIGIGYGDGYPRELSMQGAEVLISGKRCPLLGRVTMDQLMVDVSELDTCVNGDEVELFGTHILVNEIAQLSSAIPWSVLTGITPRVTRIYT